MRKQTTGEIGLCKAACASVIRTRYPSSVVLHCFNPYEPQTSFTSGQITPRPICAEADDGQRVRMTDRSGRCFTRAITWPTDRPTVYRGT